MRINFVNIQGATHFFQQSVLSVSNDLNKRTNFVALIALTALIAAITVITSYLLRKMYNRSTTNLTSNSTTNLTPYSTDKLTPYAKAHLSDLSFGPQDTAVINMLKNGGINQNLSLEDWDLKISQWNKRAEIVENMKITDFDTLPILEFRKKIPSSGCVEIELQEFSAPLMKGIDQHGRPFIALRVKDQKTSNVIPLTLYQRYEDDELWMYHVSPLFSYDLNEEIFFPTSRISKKQMFEGYFLNPANEAMLSQIIHNQHNRFVLV